MSHPEPVLAAITGASMIRFTLGCTRRLHGWLCVDLHVVIRQRFDAALAIEPVRALRCVRVSSSAPLSPASWRRSK